MSYHKLVERDAKNIDVHWKGEKSSCQTRSLLII